MSAPVIADTGGLLRALAGSRGRPSFPEYQAVLTSADAVLIPALVLAEVDYFLRRQRPAMRKLVGEIFDPRTRYEFAPVLPEDLVRALVIDSKFQQLELGLVDGTVAALAERRRIYRVLTIDRRDFGAIRIGTSYEYALQLIP